MKQLKYFMAAVVLAGAAWSCSDDDNFRDSIIPVEQEPMTEVDEWISENFGRYNMDVVYKWHDFQTNQEYDLVPAEESTVIPCLEVIRRIWMNPYIDLGGELFFKKTSPKQIMLLGSDAYLEDGNKVVGEADQGMRITLYGLNHKNPKETDVLEDYAQIFHHEFVHILHQLVKYPPAYEALCNGKYTLNWESVTMNNALGQGFITPYAMADPNEDFAEMVSRFVIFDATEWQAHFNVAQSVSAEAHRILREKEALALQYMQGIWGIDLYQLRDKVHRELTAIQNEFEQEQ